MIRFVVMVLALCTAGASAAPAPVHLKLPYDLAAKGTSLFVADGERRQILRYDLARRRLTVFAGTGETGTSGDGGPASKARLTEPTELVFDPAGNLYFSDVNQGRVRRIDPRGRITTVVRLRAAAGLSVDPTGRYLAIASIESGIYRMPLPGGALERLVPDAPLTGPHDVTYDAAGNLYIGAAGHVQRIDAATGTIATAFAHGGFKVIAAPDGTFYLMAGDPRGGRITQVDSSGKVLRRIGTGRIAPHRPRVRIARIGFLPSDVEPVAGAILISQVQPVPAIRRLANGSATLTTLLR
jgi:outer membrane protein assembly factor BamB